MDVSVFDVFDLTNYTFLELSRGGVAGNTVVNQYDTTGVYKLRSDIVRGENAETKESNATLHVRSTESFLSGLDNNLVGHGVLVADKQYEIVGQTGGRNYANGVLEHYTATLQETSLSNFGVE